MKKIFNLFYKLKTYFFDNKTGIEYLWIEEKIGIVPKLPIVSIEVSSQYIEIYWDETFDDYNNSITDPGMMPNLNEKYNPFDDPLYILDSCDNLFIYDYHYDKFWYPKFLKKLQFQKTLNYFIKYKPNKKIDLTDEVFDINLFIYKLIQENDINNFTNSQRKK